MNPTPKIIFGNNNPKAHIYYTQEGTPYLLRRVVRKIERFTVIPGTNDHIYLVAVFNPQNSVSNWLTISPNGSIEITQTQNKVIPVMFNFQMVQIDSSLIGINPTVANLQLPYYSLQTDFSTLGGTEFNHLNALSKMAPLVEMIEADVTTGNVTLAYGCKYGQANFQDNDFMPVQGSAAFVFDMSSANSWTARPQYVTIASTFDVVGEISFTYFELQK